MTEQPDDVPTPDRGAAEPAGGAVGAASPADDAVGDLTRSLEGLRTRLGTLRLPLETPGADRARDARRRSVDQLDDYLLPRLRSQQAPLLVVVGGSTGAGKSTLVNSVLGEDVTVPGVLRPTTRAPVLVHHPLDARWFTGDRVLPGLSRVTGAGGPPSAGRTTGGGAPGPAEPRTLRMVASETLPRGLALLDAPDIDSVEQANRDLATQLLGAADLWLFVTTAARYADAVPWDLLTSAAERRAQVAMVLDRVDPGAEATVDDLRDLMAEQGLGEARLFVVPEAGLTPEGYLPERAVAPVADWLTDLGGDAGARAHVIAATRDGVVDDLVRRAEDLADAADAQEEADARLRAVVAGAYADAVAHVNAATSDGALLRGEVLARWQDFVGTGEFFRAVEHGIGRVRDAIGGFFRGRPREAPQVEQAIAHGLESVVLDAAEGAAERAYAGWRGDAAGRALLDGLDLSRASGALRADVGEQIRGWQSDVLNLVREQGSARRGTARALSLGVNGLGVALMIFVFASTGGLSGIEVGIAGGTAVLAQRLLEAVFGEDAVRRLAVEAKERLGARVRVVMDGQAARYTAQLDAVGSADAGGGALRDAARAVADAASAERDSRDSAGTGNAAAPASGTEAPARGLRGAGAGGYDIAGAPGTGPAGAATAVGPPGRSGAGPGDADGSGTEEESGRRRGFWHRLFGRAEAGR
ncbi:dynamin family protein [Myceligenerans pegani]|uniref:Dynamin family protein n=1 Tax=Myceligenerans pegani TaxID=2776917 RepID=A0ABR9N0Y8_9MICO|nr:dynamin family protein [Myceligenerans sp. TRM 65318]MBE1877320.1 dynamin family protein [Myceligenerans sp. TRM 65318]MBE3019591.1 dynamin family protein [Myceligenerans sp. TRM 65318]